MGVVLLMTAIFGMTLDTNININFKKNINALAHAFALHQICYAFWLIIRKLFHREINVCCYLSHMCFLDCF